MLPCPVIEVKDLEATLAAVTASRCPVSKPIFSFPGGRRFHFLDPGGNELAAMQADPPVIGPLHREATNSAARICRRSGRARRPGTVTATVPRGAGHARPIPAQPGNCTSERLRQLDPLPASPAKRLGPPQSLRPRGLSADADSGLP